MLQGGAEAVARGQAGEGPVDGEGDQVGDEMLGAGRQAADQQAGCVGEAPEHAKPARAVVERVIEVEEQRRAGFEKVGAGADGGDGLCAGSEAPLDAVNLTRPNG